MRITTFAIAGILKTTLDRVVEARLIGPEIYLKWSCSCVNVAKKLADRVIIELIDLRKVTYADNIEEMLKPLSAEIKFKVLEGLVNTALDYLPIEATRCSDSIGRDKFLPIYSKMKEELYNVISSLDLLIAARCKSEADVAATKCGKQIKPDTKGKSYDASTTLYSWLFSRSPLDALMHHVTASLEEVQNSLVQIMFDSAKRVTPSPEVMEFFVVNLITLAYDIGDYKSIGDFTENAIKYYQGYVIPRGKSK